MAAPAQNEASAAMNPPTPTQISNTTFISITDTYSARNNQDQLNRSNADSLKECPAPGRQAAG